MQMISSYGMSNQNNQNSKNKKILKLIIICIIVVLIVSAALIGAIYYLNLVEQRELKVYIDGVKTSVNSDTFIIKDNGKVYVSIKDIAKLLGYDVHNGEYKVNSEETTKCYVENANETASFFLNSNKISKVAPNTQDEYTNFIISEPVKSENNKLYVISDGIKIGCNVRFQYDINSNTIQIQTLPYLVTQYETSIIKLRL